LLNLVCLFLHSYAICAVIFVPIIQIFSTNDLIYKNKLCTIKKRVLARVHPKSDLLSAWIVRMKGFSANVYQRQTVLKRASKFSSQSVWCSIYCYFPETESEPKSRLQLPRERKRSSAKTHTHRPSKQQQTHKRYTYKNVISILSFAANTSRKMHSVSLTVSNLCTQQNKINKKSSRV
jgi:hypothetical protein